MTKPTEPLVIATAPFVREGATTNRIMGEVLLALVPVMAASMYFFGIVALLVMFSSCLGACLVEWLVDKGKGLGTLNDGSALLTGVLLAFTLPPAIPLWMAFLGGAVSVGLGKAIWGGLGRNLFNPALVGRAFLQASFPIALTTWTKPGGGFFEIPASTFAPPFFKSATDVVSSATPLNLQKFQDVETSLLDVFWGNTGGCLGETSAAILVIAAAYLIYKKTFDWRLCASTIVATGVFAFLMTLVYDKAFPPGFMVLSGGLLFGAVFMVTDPVTTPLSKKGAWIFGIGVGFLVVLIRQFGGLPEAVMYAILLMNAATPHIDRYTQSRQFGGGKRE